MDNTLSTVIDGNNKNRLFTVTGNHEVTFSGITLQNAYSTYGSAIYINDPNSITIVNIINCTLTKNIATVAGGAIAINGKYDNTTKTYSKFIIENSTLSYNTASTMGGAAYVQAGGLSVRHTNLVGNKLTSSTGYGGAIYNQYLTWCYGATFENNTAYDGGAVFTKSGHFYTYYNKGENTVFINNIATGSGGAIYKNGTTGVSSINNTLFFNNSAQYGGAIALIGSVKNMTIINSTFESNTASKMGGAIYNNALSTVYTSYCAFSGNDAPTGKSMYNNGGTITADYNWWGNNTNPYTSGDINFKPSNWVKMDMTTTDNGNTVDVTANLNKYTDGSKDYLLENYIPFNKVSFSSTSGSISPTEATLVNGTYTATYYKSSKASTISATIGSQTISQTINGTDVVLIVDNVTGAVNNDVNITGTITDANGNNINVGNLTLSVNGQNISTVNVTNGTFKFPVKLTNAGNYTIYVTYNGYKNTYGVTTTAGILKIEAIGTKITMDDVEGSLGDTVSLNVYVKDEYGNYVSGIAKIHIYDQDTIVNVYNGVGTAQYTIIEPLGTYKMTATFENDTAYTSSTGSANLIVTKEKVLINITDVNGEVNENVSIPINVTNRNGEPLNGTITVTFNGETKVLTLTNGQAIYNTTLPSEEGNFNLTVTFPESGDYATTTSSIVVGVGVTTTVLTGENLVIVYKTPTNYTVKLTDINGAINIGQYISIKLTRVTTGAVKTYWRTTDLEGIASLEIALAPGTYTLECNYAGIPGKFLPSSCLNTLIIQKENTTNKTVTILTANKFNQTVGAGQNFTGVLTDFSGRIIGGQHIYVNLTRIGSWNTHYWVTTDYNGEFQLPIGLSVGRYTALCSYAGTSTYQSSNAYATITVVAK